MESDFNPNNMTFGFIGLGLIGGSIAKSFRHNYKSCTIIAYNRSAAARTAAMQDGTVDIATDTVDETFSSCDYIFLCTPVEFNETYLGTLASIISPTCIITDVGSVKGNIHRAAEKCGLSHRFIGGHPMAGSEKTGYNHSDYHLIMGAVYPITATEKNDERDVKNYASLMESVGFTTVIMNPETHDRTVAAISHVPHLAAAKLALLAKESDDENGYMKLLASTGFRDTTRIAASSADVWQQICSANSESISELLGIYIQNLTELKHAIDEKNNDYVYSMFVESKKYRDEF